MRVRSGSLGTCLLLVTLSATVMTPTRTSGQAPDADTSPSNMVTVGSGDIVCAVPGIPTLALRTTGEISGREALLQPPGPPR